MPKKRKAKSRVNQAGNYTKPTMRKRLFSRIKAGGKGGSPGQWSARKAQMLAAAYKRAGGGYRKQRCLASRAGLTVAKRIPRRKGQRANSSKHSDLYTDENPKGTIKRLKFATVKDARASVSRIRRSGKSHAHKTQAAIAMEQRARVAGKPSAAGVYRAFINQQKKITAKKKRKR